MHANGASPGPGTWVPSRSASADPHICRSCAAAGLQYYLRRFQPDDHTVCNLHHALFLGRAAASRPPGFRLADPRTQPGAPTRAPITHRKGRRAPDTTYLLYRSPTPQILRVEPDLVSRCARRYIAPDPGPVPVSNCSPLAAPGPEALPAHLITSPYSRCEAWQWRLRIRFRRVARLVLAPSPAVAAPGLPPVPRRRHLRPRCCEFPAIFQYFEARCAPAPFLQILCVAFTVLHATRSRYSHDHSGPAARSSESPKYSSKFLCGRHQIRICT